jgi:hypothetical protein
MRKLIAVATLAACTLSVGAVTAGTAGAAQAHRGRLLGAAVRVSADTIGIPVDELRAALRNGQSIAQVAESKGVATQQVIDAVVVATTAKIDEAAAAGKIDAARAEELQANLPTLAERLVNANPDPEARRERREERRERRRAAVAKAAEVIGVSPDELREALVAGKSIADVAAEHGVDVGKVVDALTGLAHDRIDELVHRVPSR